MARMVKMDIDLPALLRERGAMAYEGEGVTQLQHGWQCARLARKSGAAPALVLAAWLHDIGHLAAGLPGTPTLIGVDDRHEAVGARLLDRLFGPEVSEPVAWHVAAKRYLVATRPDYRDSLSADSVRSLELQGGPMSAAECADFLCLPHAQDALRLRVWDDRAKDAALLPASSEEALAELGRLITRLAPATAS